MTTSPLSGTNSCAVLRLHVLWNFKQLDQLTHMSFEKTILIPTVICLLWVSAWAQNESSSSQLGVRFVDIAAGAGLDEFFCYSGGTERKEYILETTGAGCAFLDYDNDRDLDIFLMTASRSEGFEEGAEPSNRLYRNEGNGRFSDVTRQAGLVRSGWGQGLCAGDYDNDGWIDLYLTYYGHNVLYRNTGDGSFVDVTRKAGLYTNHRLWGVGCSFLDYDRDSDLDLFVSNYIDFDLESAPRPGENSNCLWKGIPVMCGPRGLKGLPANLYRNDGAGTFTDVSEQAGISAPGERYGLGVLVADFDNDGWPDIYVACDSTPSLLFHNNRDGSFSEMGLLAGVAYSGDGKEQAGMGVDAGDYDNDGDLDIVKTNFSDDKSSLYKNHGDGTFSDATSEAGLGVNLAYLGWGVGFLDYDHDGFDDIFIANGHVYPEIDGHGFRSRYRQRKVLYRNTGRSTFVDVTASSGADLLQPQTSRGIALGDFDNDGTLEILVNNENGRPSLYKNLGPHGNWIVFLAIGSRSNRSAIGTRVSVVVDGGRRQIKEVHSGGTYASQSDLRLHFGLGSASKTDVEVRWPDGSVEKFAGVAANQFLTITEGVGIEGAKN